VTGLLRQIICSRKSRGPGRRPGLRQDRSTGIRALSFNCNATAPMEFTVLKTIDLWNVSVNEWSVGRQSSRATICGLICLSSYAEYREALIARISLYALRGIFSICGLGLTLHFLPRFCSSFDFKVLPWRVIVSAWQKATKFEQEQWKLFCMCFHRALKLTFLHVLYSYLFIIEIVHN